MCVWPGWGGGEEGGAVGMTHPEIASFYDKEEVSW